MNLCIHTGNLTRDPETRVMQGNGKKRSTFTLAVNRKYKNAQGSYDADFIQFTAYDKTAEMVEKYLAKGRKVEVTSHVKTGSYEKDGRKIYTTEFVVESIGFLSSKEQASYAGAAGTPAPTANVPAGSYDGYSEYGDFTPVNDDELPF